MATYCTLDDIADEFPWLSSFTTTSRPSSTQVTRYIIEAANEMEAAIVSGAHLALPVPSVILTKSEYDALDSSLQADYVVDSMDANIYNRRSSAPSEAAQWMKETNVQGALQRIGRFLYSYGRGGDSGRIPWQKDFAMRVKQLRDGDVQWGDKKVEPSTKQLPALRQKFG